MQNALYIVATPIGNLEDITLRALRILKEVDIIAAEDTRHTRKLLSHYSISKPLISYFDHNKNLKDNLILSKLTSGVSVALVTDAGTPCISDPGFNLVRDAIAAGVRVVPIPGASALITALSAAGLPSDRFTFAGFPPNSESKRSRFLSSFLSYTGTIIFYESPKRLIETLKEMHRIFGDCNVAVARELTKIHETFYSGSALEVIQQLEFIEIKGEIVILLTIDEKDDLGEVNVEDELTKLVEKGFSTKDAIKSVSESFGIKRRDVYETALKLREKVET